jgi:hypothetical protein
MAHKVTVDMPPRPLQRQDVTFKVRRDDKLLGTLEISNGSVVWFPRGTSYGCKIGWNKFDEMMQSQATRFEKR